MKTLFYPQSSISDAVLKEIASGVQKGEIVAFPTETVYGLGASIFEEEAVKKIFTLKNRASNKGLIVHISKISDVNIVAEEIPEEFYVLAKAFFPGPLTIVLKKKKNVSSIISPDNTIAIRMPNHTTTLKLIDFVKCPIVGTSANISNESSLIDAMEVKKLFQDKIFAIIDGGISLLKLPSTILSVQGKPQILRQGSIGKDEIQQVLKMKVG
ncbi:MAG: threonylcarbamoyl-AMP synthase [Chlamydiae bacterium]|nr:threonylcarbamoyl-AMP synthase [Chlamydiota bacterium]